MKFFNYLTKNIYLLKSIFWLITILIGILQAWSNRFNLSSADAVSYLDIGDAYFRGDWNAAINAYWSPFYSWLLGLTISTFNITPYWEFLAVKLVNLCNLIFAIICFEFFLRQLILYHQKGNYHPFAKKTLEIPEWVWTVIGYTLFLWSSLVWIGVNLDAPDMATSALVYLAAGILLQLHIQPVRWSIFIILGIVLGFGYLSKSVMFPLAFVFFIVAMFTGENIRRIFPKVLAAILAFMIIALPFVTAISLAKGRLTFGDTGKLNYVWYVSKNIDVDRFWQGKELDSGIPKHPPQTISNNFLIYEFKTNLKNSSPFWYEPSYWFEGVELKFKLKQQIKVLLKNAHLYYQLFIFPLIICYVILVFVSSHIKTALKDLVRGWSLLAVAMGGLGFYMIGIDLSNSFIATRYIAPFIVVLFAGVFTNVYLLNSQQSKKMLITLTIIALVSTSSNLGYHISKDLKTVLKGTEHTYWNIAQDLNRLGVKPGDKVAVLGHDDKNTYWARLAGVQITTEVFNPEKFWQEKTATQSEVIQAIKKTGVKVIVQQIGWTMPKSVMATGWQRIGNTDCYAYFFKK
ncbi:hypothetical protein [Iningainema tapete]|uniref:Glycosyltransferase RgtA/B/C/D-like domain-containing protein n=1 Tax=Iningainema tapete BLCC-T55 TaxID=2748662 RepID=A0A8J7CAN9_9CYAN|nr:hypothetical protein [Iningainema tapete]MBD2777346.1 hypothetical protein [Iningainema tapete BLCC-T55]